MNEMLTDVLGTTGIIILCSVMYLFLDAWRHQQSGHSLEDVKPYPKFIVLSFVSCVIIFVVSLIARIWL